MYITDLVTEFKTTYDLGGIGLPGYEDVEIKKLLEINQYKLISQKIGGNNVYNSKFPDTNKRIDDLQGLITEANGTYMGSFTPSGYAWVYNTSSRIAIITFPDNFLHLIEDGVSVTDSTYTEIAKEIPINVGMRYNAGRRNRIPYIKTPVFHFIDSTVLSSFPNSEVNRKIRLFRNSDTDSLTDNVLNIKCLYIRKPVNLTMVTDALYDFNDDVYHELVAMAVDQAIDIASPNKSQVSKQTLKQAE